MLPLKSISLLGLTPILQSSACRLAPLFFQQDLRPQCFPINLNGDCKSSTRSPTFPRSYSTATITSSLQHGFTYRVAASFSAKGRPFDPTKDHYTYPPQSRKGKKDRTGKPASGQDAFFIKRVGNGTSMAFGVADGVGGWSNSGIDSAHFSHGLCEHMIEAAQTTNQTEEKTFGAEKLLQIGYDGVVADESISGGGSTACVAVGREDGSVQVAK